MDQNAHKNYIYNQKEHLGYWIKLIPWYLKPPPLPTHKTKESPKRKEEEEEKAYPSVSRVPHKDSNRGSLTTCKKMMTTLKTIDKSE